MKVLNGSRPQAGLTPRRKTLRVLPVLVAMAMLALAVAAPSAMAWHGNLIVKKVNVGGPAGDKFDFTLSKNPNSYQDVWNPATKTFQLSGAASAAGPFTEGTNMKTFSSLWAGQDSNYNHWVTYSIKEAAKAGYTTTVACSIDGGTTWTTVNQITAQYGQWSFTSSSTANDTTAATSVRWINNTSYNTTCVFTNKYKARLKVKKTFDDPVSQSPSVKVQVDNVDQGVNGTSDLTFENGNTTAWLDRSAGATPTIGETDGSAAVADYTKTLTCDNYVTGTVQQDGTWKLSALPAGKDVTCTINNKREHGKIQVLKFTNPQSITSGFDLRVDGTAKASDVGNGGDTGEVLVAAGSHTASETAAGGGAVSGYDTKSYCVNNPSSAITAASFADAQTTSATSQDVTVHAGDRWVCAFLNTKHGTFKVIKKFTGPSGTDKVKITIGGEPQNVDGSDPATDEFGNDDATPVIGGIAAGTTETFGETGAGSTDLSYYDKSVSCSNDTSQQTGGDGEQFSATVGAGEDVVCTITNRRKTGHLTLKKIIDPSTDTGQFVLNAGDNATEPLGNGESQKFTDIATGDYQLSEAAAEGTDGALYKQTDLSCSYDESPAERVASPLEGDTVTVQDGDSITCKFTNTRKGTIKLVKKFLLGNEAYNSPDSVNLHLNEETKAVTGAGGETSTQSVAGGSSNTVSESFASEDVAALYDAGEPVCVDQNQAPVSVDGSSVVVAAGSDVVCTITNRRHTGRLTLRKLLVPSTDTAAFVLNAGAFTTGPLGNDQSQTFDNVPTGSYKLGEQAQAGYDLTGSECVYNPTQNTATPTGGIDPPVNPLDPNGNVVVSDRTDITCTLTNTKQTTTTTVTPPTGDVSPVTPSGGTTARKAAARLSGTVGCAARTASAAIKGTQIKRVTFYLDGKKVKTLNGKENAKGSVTFRFTKSTKSLKYGSHKLTAKVQFFAASKASPKTYRLTFSRCQPRVVRPNFTG